jgi:hypothetical protein
LATFALGFGATLIILLGLLGLYYLLPAKTAAPALAPTVAATPAMKPIDVAGDSVGSARVDSPSDSQTVAVPTVAPAQKIAAAPVVPAPEPAQPAPAVAMVDDQPAQPAPPALKHDVVIPGKVVEPSGLLYIDGAKTDVHVVMASGQPYVVAESVALKTGSVVAEDGNQVKIDGQPVTGKTVMSGDQLMVPLQNLAKAMHRQVTQSQAGWRLDKIVTGDAPRKHGALAVTAPHIQADVPPAPADDAPPAAAPPTLVQPPVYNPNPLPEAFRPIIQNTTELQVCITNVRFQDSFNDKYKPADGHVFCIVEGTVQNTSNIMQMTEGTWNLSDQQGSTYKVNEHLSTLTMSSMRMAGMNVGYLVFEVNQGAVPSQLTFHQEGHGSMTFNLIPTTP